MPAPDAELIAWKCRACGEWVSEYNYRPTECPVDWRNERKRQSKGDTP